MGLQDFIVVILMFGPASAFVCRTACLGGGLAAEVCFIDFEVRAVFITLP